MAWPLDPLLPFVLTLLPYVKAFLFTPEAFYLTGISVQLETMFAMASSETSLLKSLLSGI